MSNSDLTDLGWDLASDGFVGRESAVRHAVRAAREAGVSTVVTGVLADPRQPDVARLRAFGRIAAVLAARDARGPATSTRAA